ncbi:MAG TPA: hypothetical protein VJV05_03860 [Pyrinomonadaceae bacterium]|nr:hypothetical protein [Pyrinomonadaceae bacterium]
MKVLRVIVLMMLASGIAMAQQAGGRTPTALPGVVYGAISIEEVSGNNLGNFGCSNMTVSVSKLNGGWKRTVTAIGDFGARRCSYRITNVRAGEQFVATLSAQFPKGCDEKKFETSTSFPMALKGGEQMKYNFGVTRVRCVLVK